MAAFACLAVRAPGVKWTRLAYSREADAGVATVSMNTMPVNQSLGPGVVPMLFLVIFIAYSDSGGRSSTRVVA